MSSERKRDTMDTETKALRNIVESAQADPMGRRLVAEQLERERVRADMECEGVKDLEAEVARLRARVNSDAEIIGEANVEIQRLRAIVNEDGS